MTTNNPTAPHSKRRAATTSLASMRRMLPKEARLAMPQQQFARAVEAAPGRRMNEAWIPRAAIFTATMILSLGFASELYGVLSLVAITPMQVAFLVLSSLAFAWIALGTLNAAFGFIHLYANEKPDTIALPTGTAPLTTKTALLFPIYKEDPALIAGTIEAVAHDLERTGQSNKFEVFVLSDTPTDHLHTNGQVELETFSRLRTQLSGKIKVYYRRRTRNTGRKAGNIQDWVKRFGARYSHFVIFDADSVMSAQTLVALARTMQRTPNAGLIQTVPRLTGAVTLLQHIQQFASNIYGPSASAGLALWHRDQGNYWGHNAIIRTIAFASAAGLPVLRGKAPFGGHIQSHDFVEAALMQRAGWAIHMAPTTTGSYEGSPPTLPELVSRDRRWTQGNLQHLALVGTRGLTPMGRTHLLLGACSYLVSMIWGASIFVGILLALQGRQMIPTYFTDEKTLFPIWPVTDPGSALKLFAATLVLVLLPKFLGGILEIRRARAAREEGGTSRAIAGVTTETIFSMLLAPIFMVTQTIAVVQVLLGRDSGWSAQARDENGVTLKLALRQFLWPTLVGFALTLVCLNVSYQLTAWMLLPMLAGTICAAPIAWYTARPVSRLLRLVLSTPEDRTRPAILDQTERCHHSWRAQFSLSANSNAPVEPIAAAA